MSKKRFLTVMVLVGSLVAQSGFTNIAPMPRMEEPVDQSGAGQMVQETQVQPQKQKPTGQGTNQQGGGGYSIEQAISDNAQLSTIAFSGLAFITGSAGADTFMPPGKVADYFGFQYMRDVDQAGYGHNTTFLSRVANNVLYILNDSQKAKLVALAKKQAPLYNNFAYNRYPLMNAFRRSLEDKMPTGSDGLDQSVVSAYTGNLYLLDGQLSYDRAAVVGGVIASFDDKQKAYLAKMSFDNYNTWPNVEEDQDLKKNLTNTEFVAVMTYASELFSWYKGSMDADVYFCPERHGTYFGGFYMKDYPAMNNPNYFISTALTGDSGQEFLKVLDDEQRALVTSIIGEQKDAMNEIVQIRTDISTELRKAMNGGTMDKEKVMSLSERYGELDGYVSWLYADRFSQVNRTLTSAQRAKLVALRNLSVVPQGGYCFSTPVAMPKLPNTDYFFGVSTMPSTAAKLTAPTGFSSSEKNTSVAPKPGTTQNVGNTTTNTSLQSVLDKMVANKSITSTQSKKIITYFEKYKSKTPGVPAPKGSDPISMLIKDKVITSKQAELLSKMLPKPTDKQQPQGGQQPTGGQQQQPGGQQQPQGGQQLPGDQPQTPYDGEQPSENPQP